MHSSMGSTRKSCRRRLRYRCIALLGCTGTDSCRDRNPNVAPLACVMVIAVGTALRRDDSGRPRTDPACGATHWALASGSDVKALLRPGMHDTNRRKPSDLDSFHPVPVDASKASLPRSVRKPSKTSSRRMRRTGTIQRLRGCCRDWRRRSNSGRIPARCASRHGVSQFVAYSTPVT